MSYEAYNKSAGYLGWLLTPATVCLAVPLYKQIHLLKAYKAAVAASIGAYTYIYSYFSCLRYWA